MKDSKRATVYFDADIHQALRLKAAAADRSISDVVNEAVKVALAEDADVPIEGEGLPNERHAPVVESAAYMLVADRSGPPSRGDPPAEVERLPRPAHLLGPPRAAEVPGLHHQPVDSSSLKVGSAAA